MKRCTHDWQPLMTVPAGLPDELRLLILQALRLKCLDIYEVCVRCDRLSRLRRHPFKGRALICWPRLEERIRHRAADMQGWIHSQATTAMAPSPTA